MPMANRSQRTLASCRCFAMLVTLALADRAPVVAGLILHDVTPQTTGITFRHTDGSSGHRYIVESVSAGLALFDYDGDGDVDIYFLDGAPLRGTEADSDAANRLYRNDGNWHFTDVTEQARVGDRGFGLGVAAADYDNDGDLDVYVNNYGPNVLLRNNGDGTFTDVSTEAGVANGHRVGAGTFFFDMDRDGDLDLFVSNYLDFRYENHLRRSSQGVPKYAGPLDFPPMANTLYRNNGDGTFTDVSIESGIAAHAGWGMGGVCADYDDDGDTDIYLANDVYANFLFQNDGTGRFREVGLMAGLAYDLQGDEQGSMGIECADYDNDGRLDFYQTSYSKELALLYRNLGAGLFSDVTLLTGAGSGTFALVTWGTGMVDFDNDGDRDLFVATGHVQDNIERYDNTVTSSTRNVLLLHQAGGSFIDVSGESGDGMDAARRSRGAAFDDLDDDGDIDVVVLNAREMPSLLRNDTTPRGHWLQIRLQGTRSNRDGVGARVTVVTGALSQIDEVHSGRGYQSHYGMRLHFGLGAHRRVDRIEVRWLGGETDVWHDVNADQVFDCREGDGQSKPLEP